MHKRTLYISASSAKRIDQLAQKQNTTKADILRRAVEKGLASVEEKPVPNNPTFASPQHNTDTSSVLKNIDNTIDNLLAHFFKLILR